MIFPSLVFREQALWGTNVRNHKKSLASFLPTAKFWHRN